jgi:nucleoside 2-deoxyribosyltransferase
MTNVFISYSRDDKELADNIRRALADAGVATSTADDTITPGARWRETLVKKLGQADAVVAVVSKSTVESSWTMTELGIAWGANKKIIGVLAPSEPPDELEISPLKDVKLLRVAKTDMADVAAEILEATADAPHRPDT